ncbi:hypothetical protein [uncultured Tateyamaria sp.]|uniref:hypothetical protein n=1 Tax=uncultured Tateyamaria sp. TaxID=455651 RepID=UPI0026053D19|nr:hypothetical protein [uncultured Tateyamaria sp.]
MKTLNITNGDGAANTIKQSIVTGDVLPWRDPMHHGPFPAKLSLSELGNLRAEYLAGPDADATDVKRDFQLRDRHLNAAPSYDKVTLWFEHDLLDQLQILQILDWFSRAPMDDIRLDMICIDRFAEKPDFKGIGQLNADQMASLVPLQQPVTETMLKLAAAGWAAFRSSDPNDLLAFLDNDLRELSFLAAALQRHFEEFPNAVTGLTRTETQVLSLMGQNVSNPKRLFLQNMDMETALFIGDWPTYQIIGSLCAAGLAACEPSPFRFPSFTSEAPPTFDDQRVSLTEVGRRVLNGEEDAFGLMRRDGWLGGVEVTSSDTVWTWNKGAAQFARRTV